MNTVPSKFAKFDKFENALHKVGPKINKQEREKHCEAPVI
jgi:hypothetical protein